MYLQCFYLYCKIFIARSFMKFIDSNVFSKTFNWVIYFNEKLNYFSSRTIFIRFLKNVLFEINSLKFFCFSIIMSSLLLNFLFMFDMICFQLSFSLNWQKNIYLSFSRKIGVSGLLSIHSHKFSRFDKGRSSSIKGCSFNTSINSSKMT